jgi:hypothetical protein
MRPTVPPFRRRPSTRRNVLIALAAGSYLAWSFMPVWYRVTAGRAEGVTVPPALLNAWGGPTEPAALLALIAVAWVGARAGRELRRPAAVVSVDLALAVAALLLTLAGILFRRQGPVSEAAPSWGLAVGVVLAGAWAFCAIRALREAAGSDLGHP